MYAISKRFTFSAMHSLPQLPPEHKCHREHGHNYVVEVVLTAESLDKYGMVKDYAHLDGFKDWLAVELDHRNLNHFMDRMGYPSTAECLARVLHAVASGLLDPGAEAWTVKTVRVRETENTWADFTP